MPSYLYGALTRLVGLSTIRRAELLGREELLLRLRSGGKVPELHPSISKAAAKLDWEACERQDREAQARGIQLLSWDDGRYPAALRTLPDPPPALYLLGSVEALEGPAVAVVGSRLCTVYGQNVAQTLAAEWVRSGLTVVSGLARGIDSSAHEGSLVVPGRAVAVLGTGIDVPYPRENEGLMRRIVERGGAVVTEFPPGTPPAPRNFPIRNRVIAGLVWGVVIVEATERSGSLITARFALETGREVFAVPQNITSRTAVGPNTLIQKGAKLIQRGQDLLEELPEHLRCKLKQTEEPAGATPDTLSERSAMNRRLLALLKPDRGLSVDELCRSSDLPASEVLSGLLELQMAGVCVELPGMRYALKGRMKEPH